MMTNDSKDQGREAFEAWCEREGIDADKSANTGVYSYPSARVAWRAWQAALACATSSGDMRDAYIGAREDLSIWKKRALEAEDLNRKFTASVNGPMFMGEPALATSASALARDEASVALMSDDEIARFLHAVYGTRGFPFTVYGARELVHGLQNWLGRSASPAASSAATVSDAASVDALAEISSKSIDADCARVVDDNFFDMLATPQAATTAGAQDEQACKCRRLGDWKGAHHPLCARTASSATAPLTSDSEANQTLPQHAMPAWRDVVRERRRQIGVEGWTPEHDDGHDAGSLAAAGSAYAIAAADKLHPYSQGDADFYRQPPDAWPWHFKWWKPKDPRTALVKAGALILAEIERIDRAQSTNGEQS
jgi:hypothetical protein